MKNGSTHEQDRHRECRLKNLRVEPAVSGVVMMIDYIHSMAGNLPSPKS
jgi:hypothetical protein